LIKEQDIDLLIAFFGIYDSSVNGRTRIQKDICILKYKECVPFNFEFEPHYYGPYSSELTGTVDTLVAAGILQEKVEFLANGVSRYDYGLTLEGEKMFQMVKQKIVHHDETLYNKLEKTIACLKKKSIPQVVAEAKASSGMQSTV
jgi:uncharacterized protein YwgA